MIEPSIIVAIINHDILTAIGYENGVVKNIPYDKLILLAKALETTPAVLMGWETPPERPQTLAAHFEGDDFTEEELQDIMAYAEFVKHLISPLIIVPLNILTTKL